MNGAIDKILKNPILLIAKKETMDTIRNKWIIVMIAIITFFTILASYGGSVYSNTWGDLAITVAAMVIIVQLFVSIMGLMLGYSTIVGEVEKGSMNSLLSFPLTRLEILIGKFIGLGAILSFALFVGFGIGGLIIGLNVENVNYGEYFSFIGASILMGLVFISIGILFSCVMKKRSTAMGASIVIWIIFMPLVWGMMMLAIGAATNIFDLTNLTSFSIPGWYYALDMVNPLQVYSYLVTLNIPEVLSSQSDISEAVGLPDFITGPLTTGILLLWIIGCNALAFFKFTKNDI